MRVAARGSRLDRIVVGILGYVVERLDRDFSALLLEEFGVVTVVDLAEFAVRTRKRVVQHIIVVALVIRVNDIEQSRDLIRTGRFRPGERRKPLVSYSGKKREELCPGRGESVVVGAGFAVEARGAILRREVGCVRAHGTVGFEVQTLFVEQIRVEDYAGSGVHKRHGVVLVVVLFENVGIAVEHGVLDGLRCGLAGIFCDFSVLVEVFLCHDVGHVREKFGGSERFVVAGIEKIQHRLIVFHRSEKLSGVKLGVLLRRAKNDAGFAVLETLICVVRLEVLFHFVEIDGPQSRVEYADVEVRLGRIFFFAAARANARAGDRR